MCKNEVQLKLNIVFPCHTFESYKMLMKRTVGHLIKHPVTFVLVMLVLLLVLMLTTKAAPILTY